MSANGSFSNAEKAAVYRAIYERRDMRHFTGGKIEPETLERMLGAAHAAPSVGLMQPWRFIRISDPQLRETLYQQVQQERLATAEALGERSGEFMQLKVEGIRDCAECLVVSLMGRREAHIFGRRTMPHMDIASTACAIQNLWLAARAESLGMGWVSLFEPGAMRSLLSMPADAEPLAILCLGPVSEFYSSPMLEQQHWAQRHTLATVLMDNHWHDEHE